MLAAVHSCRARSLSCLHCPTTGYYCSLWSLAGAVASSFCLGVCKSYPIFWVDPLPPSLGFWGCVGPCVVKYFSPPWYCSYPIVCGLPLCLHGVRIASRDRVISWACLIRIFQFCYLLLTSGALVVPRFVCSFAYGALPGVVVSGLGGTVSGAVLLRAVAACCYCLALGSYVAVVLALIALLQSALTIV